ncbi:MAG: PKD domain-containing protein [Blastocatellia bacterium]|nr:PKD domain-containing protein [Blastocatellia bacterium]
MLIGLFAVLSLSTSFVWGSLAARRSQADREQFKAASMEKLPPVRTSGPVLTADAAPKFTAFQAAPFQGCTVNCTATVPTTGQNGVAIAFAATATTSGCTAQPTFEWDFGDGSAKSNQQNPSKTYASAGTYNWTLTTTVGSGSTSIDTIAGGLGEGNPAKQAAFGVLSGIARDPQGRGIYVADSIGNSNYIRFVNTSTSDVTIGGRVIAAGTVRAIAGGGVDISDNIPGVQADIGAVSGLGVSNDGNLVYFVNSVDAVVRGINVSGSNQTVGGQTVASGNVGTLATGFGTSVNGLSVHPTTGDVYVADATAGTNKVFKITPAGQSTPFAGNGANTKADDAFSAGPALNIPLLQPRAVKVESNGSLLIADTGHGRIIRVDAGGSASLVNQFTINQQNPNPYPSGLAIQGGSIYVANGNQQTVVRVTGAVTTIAGTPGAACDYSSSTCGDGGPAGTSGFNMLGSTATPPVAAIDADANGIIVADQGVSGKGRIRYINLTGGAVAQAGTSVPAGAIQTIGGSGLAAPYDGGLATGATFNTPTGVALDSNGNMWVSDTISARVRFINRSAASTTIFAGTPAEQVVPAGTIVTVNKNVGSGSNDGVPVIQAAFDSPQGLFSTSQGVYVADSKSGPTVPPQFSGRRTSLIRFINTSSANVTIFPGSTAPIVIPPGNIAKIAGGSENSSSIGDGGFALNAKFIGAADVAVTANGTIYVADVGQKAVRKIDGQTGVVSSLTLPAKQYTGVGLGPDGRLYIANYDDGVILRENSAGGGSFSNLTTGLNKPRDVAVGADGTSYVTVGLTTSGVSGVNNHQIVQVTAAGAATVLAGSTAGFAGDGGPAATSMLNISPSALVVGSGTTNQLPETVNIVVGTGGEILFTDSNNNRIRRLAASASVCVKTGTITITGSNPVPVITSISPNSATQSSPAFTLTVNGTGFIQTSVIRWKGADRPTSYVGNTQLTAQSPAGDLATAGAAAVTVFNPAPGGGLSNSVDFSVNAPNPVPTITSLSPNTAVEGGAGFTLTVNGTGFVNGSAVRWDGQARTTTFVSATQLTAQILASDIIGAGTAAVSVFNPTPGGGVSNMASFAITSNANPQPALTSINPSSATAGAAAFTMTATGNGFVSTSKIRWNGADLTTTFVTATQLTAQVPANLVATAGTAQVTIFSPTPGGGSSAPLTFTINSVAQNNPTIASISPAMVGAGGAGFTLTVTGTNFVSGSTVRIAGNSRATTFVSATQLTATIASGDIAAAGSFDITVLNPGNATASNAVKLEVVAPVATVSAASFLGQRLSAESIVAAFGVNLATGVEVAATTPLPTTLLGTTVKVKDAAGMERDAPLFFVAPSQINYQVPPGTADGAATVTVVSNNKVVGLGTITIAKVAPGFISANSNGQGVAAAVALRVKGSAQTFEAVASFDQGTSRFVPIQIDLGAADEQVYLIMYGTGFRQNTGLANVKFTIGGAELPASAVLFAGGAPGFIGLDQANLGPIPRSLIGRGTVDIVMTVDGQVANTVQIAIK